MSATGLAVHLPPAERVLELGSDDALRASHRLRAGHTQWQRAADMQALLALPDASFDLVVVSQALPPGDAAVALLTQAARLAAPGAPLLLQASNSGRFALVERLALGDSGDGDAGLAEAAAQAGLSAAGLYKLLLDCGWAPDLLDPLPLQPQHQAPAAALCAVAQGHGMPAASARRTLAVGGLVVRGERSFGPAPQHSGRARFSVVVPTTRELQFRADILASPGLHEVDAQVVRCDDARSPADALARALPQCDSDWVLMAHQDVYFPRGFGHRLNAMLAELSAGATEHLLIGFAGIGVDAQAQAYHPAGFVIDRLSRFDHPASQAAVSIDEFALLLPRRTVHRIDPAIGWHLWGTELCLAAICEHKVFPRIVRLPVFHDSWNDYVLPPAFHESAAYLAAKYRGFGPIHTLCGVVDDAFVARHRRAA